MDLVAGLLRQCVFARKALRAKHLFLVPELAQAVRTQALTLTSL
jgi:hypothetical protein